MSADDSMDLDYGLPASQPAFLQLSYPVQDKRARISWQNSQSSSQSALASRMAADGGDLLFSDTPASAPVPEEPVASTSASAPAPVSATRRLDRRRRRGQREEPQPADASGSALLSMVALLSRTAPENPLVRPQLASKENRNEREKRSSLSATLLSKNQARSREASGSSATTSGPRTPDSDVSRPWPAPQEGATSSTGNRTRSLGSAPIAQAAGPSSIRHHSLPELARRDNDVSMGNASDECSVTDAFSRTALDSPVVAWPSPVTEKSSPAPDRHSILSDTSHLPPDTSLLPDTSRLLPTRSSSPVTSSHRVSGPSRPSVSRTSSSSTAIPAHRSRESTPQTTSVSAAPSGNRSLKRTGSRTLSRNEIFKAIAEAPPSPEVSRRVSTSLRQSAPPGHRPPPSTTHAPNPSQRPRMLGMRRDYKPYTATTAKRSTPAPAAPPASQGFRIQAFKPPLAKKTAPHVVPKPERASTPPRPPPRKPVQVPTPDSSQPHRKPLFKTENMDEEKMLDVGDSSFDVSFGIDPDTLDAAMEQYD